MLVNVLATALVAGLAVARPSPARRSGSVVASIGGQPIAHRSTVAHEHVGLWTSYPSVRSNWQVAKRADVGLDAALGSLFKRGDTFTSITVHATNVTNPTLVGASSGNSITLAPSGDYTLGNATVEFANYSLPALVPNAANEVCTYVLIESQTLDLSVPVVQRTGFNVSVFLEDIALTLDDILGVTCFYLPAPQVVTETIYVTVGAGSGGGAAPGSTTTKTETQVVPTTTTQAKTTTAVVVPTTSTQPVAATTSTTVAAPAPSKAVESSAAVAPASSKAAQSSAVVAPASSAAAASTSPAKSAASTAVVIVPASSSSAAAASSKAVASVALSATASSKASAAASSAPTASTAPAASSVVAASSGAVKPSSSAAAASSSVAAASSSAAASAKASSAAITSTTVIVVPSSSLTPSASKAVASSSVAAASSSSGAAGISASSASAVSASASPSSAAVSPASSIASSSSAAVSASRNASSVAPSSTSFSASASVTPIVNATSTVVSVNATSTFTSTIIASANASMSTSVANATSTSMSMNATTTATPNATATLTEPLAAYQTDLTFNGRSFVNKGLVGFGAISGDAVDSRGETIGGIGSAISLVSFSKVNDTTFTGVMAVQPDRGHNTQTTSDFVGRHHFLPFTLRPYYAAANLEYEPAKYTFDLSYESSVFYYESDGTPTTGLDATAYRNATSSMPIEPIASASYNHISTDAEGLVLNADGSFWVSDEYGPYIWRYSAEGVLLSTIVPPQAFIPMLNGELYFSAEASTPPSVGRSQNQGFEGLTASPDGSKLYVLLQSALMQDLDAALDDGRYTRMLCYDVSGATPVLEHSYVIELPVTNGKGKTLKTSDFKYLADDTFMMLIRDGKANGDTDSDSKHKDFYLINTAGATDIAATNYTHGYTPVAPLSVLDSSITAIVPTQFVDMIDDTQLARFGLHNGDQADVFNVSLVNSKWESSALASVQDPAYPNDYFLFSFSDNDFISIDGYEAGASYVDPYGLYSLDNQALVWRVTLPYSVPDS